MSTMSRDICLRCRDTSQDSGGGIRTRDLRVMSPIPRVCWTAWGSVSRGFCEIAVGWNRLESVAPVAPSVAPLA
jgi:hypothetical protein